MLPLQKMLPWDIFAVSHAQCTFQRLGAGFEILFQKSKPPQLAPVKHWRSRSSLRSSRNHLPENKAICPVERFNFGCLHVQWLFIRCELAQHRSHILHLTVSQFRDFFPLPSLMRRPNYTCTCFATNIYESYDFPNQSFNRLGNVK